MDGAFDREEKAEEWAGESGIRARDDEDCVVVGVLA